MRYAIVIERVTGNYSAYVPDLSGCIATGGSLDEIRAEIGEAITFHLQGMREDRLPTPKPASRVGYANVAGT